MDKREFKFMGQLDSYSLSGSHTFVDRLL